MGLVNCLCFWLRVLGDFHRLSGFRWFLGKDFFVFECFGPGHVDNPTVGAREKLENCPCWFDFGNGSNFTRDDLRSRVIHFPLLVKLVRG